MLQLCSVTLVHFFWQPARERAVPSVDDHPVTPLRLLHTPLNSFAAPLRGRILNWRLNHYIITGLTRRVGINCPSQFKVGNYW